MQVRRRRALQPIDSEEPADDMDYRSDEKPIKSGEEQKQSSPIVPVKSEAASKVESEAAASKASKVEPEASVAAKSASVPAKSGDTASLPVSGDKPDVPNAAIATGVLGIDSDAQASLLVPPAVSPSSSSNSNSNSKSNDNNPIKNNNENNNENSNNKSNLKNDAEISPPLPEEDSSDYASDLHESKKFRQPQEDLCKNYTMPLIRKTINGINYYNFTFSMFVTTQRDEGLYNLYFHACPNYDQPKMLSFNVS